MSFFNTPFFAHSPARTAASRVARPVRRPFGVTTAAAALALAAPLGLAACSSTGDGPADTSGQHVTTEQAGSITIADAWAKASADDMHAGEGMTGVFAELTNHGDTDLTITGLSSPAAGIVELHEVVDGVMRKIQGDVTIPAGGNLVLEPGANHIMLMEMVDPLHPGDDVVITLTLSDGSDVTVTALVKDTSGANESYGDLEGEHGETESGHDAH